MYIHFPIKPIRYICSLSKRRLYFSALGVTIIIRYLQVVRHMLYCSLMGGEAMLRNTEILAAVRMSEIERLVNEFREMLEKGFADAQNIIDINEIEELWTRLRTGTDGVYADMLSDYLASIDEREIIRQKKTSFAKGE